MIHVPDDDEFVRNFEHRKPDYLVLNFATEGLKKYVYPKIEKMGYRMYHEIHPYSFFFYLDLILTDTIKAMSAPRGINQECTKLWQMENKKCNK